MPVVAGAVGVEVIALLALILLYAFLVFGHYSLAVPFSQIPGIGGTIAGAIDGAFSAVEGVVKSWMRTLVWPIAQLIGAIPTAASMLWGANVDALATLTFGMQRIMHQALPAVYTQLLQNAALLAQNAAGEAEHYADAAVSSAFRGMSEIVAAQVGNIEGEIAGVGYGIAATAAALGNQIAGTATELRSEISGVAAWAEQGLANEQGRALQAESAVAQFASIVAGAAQDRAQEFAGNVGAAIHQDAVVRDALVAATAAAATATVAAELTAYLETCGNDLCSGLSGLSRLLPALTGLMATGELMAIVYQCANDPIGGARDVAGAVGGVAEGGLDLFRTVTGH